MQHDNYNDDETPDQDKLEDLQARISVLKSSSHSGSRDGNGIKNDNHQASYAASGVTLIVELICGVLVGCFVGFHIDIYFDTLPMMLFFCVIFGGAAGLYNFYRLEKTKNLRGRE